jgi:hypothetical protein
VQVLIFLRHPKSSSFLPMPCAFSATSTLRGEVRSNLKYRLLKLKCSLSLLRLCPTQNAHARIATSVVMEQSYCKMFYTLYILFYNTSTLFFKKNKIFLITTVCDSHWTTFVFLLWNVLANLMILCIDVSKKLLIIFKYRVHWQRQNGSLLITYINVYNCQTKNLDKITHLIKHPFRKIEVLPVILKKVIL